MVKRLLDDKDYSLWILLLQVRDYTWRLRQIKLKRYGITPEEAGVLLSIDILGDNAIPTEIARWMYRKHNTILSILDRMEKKGLIKKRMDSDKNIYLRVTLTDKGRQAYYQSTDIDYIRRIMSSLNEEQRKQLILSLQALRDAVLRELGMEQKPPFP